MRLSGLVIAAILLVPAIVLAQHSSAGGGASSGGSSSGGGYSGGYSSGGSSHGSSGSSGSSSGSSRSSSSGGSRSSASSAGSHYSGGSPSHVAGKNAAASRLAPSSKLASTKENAAPEKRGFRSFLRHPFKKPAPVQTAEFKRRPCWKEPCAVCPSGRRWNGFACGVQYRFNDDCRALADQLAGERVRMQAQDDPGEALLYRSLLQQYESCMARYGSHMFSNAFLLDTPFDTHKGLRDDH